MSYEFDFQDLDDDSPCLVLSGVSGSILKLIVDALYTGQVILDGKTQLKQFETALTCLNSFGILLNLRPGVIAPVDQDFIAENDEDDDLRAKKRSRDDIETDDDSEDLKEEPIQPESEEPARKRTRASAAIAKDEATKPNFDNVTSEKLNDKVKEGQVALVKWLQKEGFLKKHAPTCNVKECHSKEELKLEEDGDVIDGASWKCTKCPNKISIREGSIFDRNKKSSTDSLSWIIQIILCWSDNTSLMQCQQLTGADVDKIFLWYDECKDYYGTL